MTMINDVKSYLNTVTARLSNAFNIQDFDFEEEAHFWSLASEYLSQPNPPTFSEIAEWVDLLYNAPVHLTYVKEGEKLKLFRQHLISKNLDHIASLVSKESKSKLDRARLIRNFEEQLQNIEHSLRFSQDLAQLGTAKFSIGPCQQIPLLKDDELWGLYCIGPFVQTPPEIVTRTPLITRILTNWLSVRYEKQYSLRFGSAVPNRILRTENDGYLTPHFNKIIQLLLAHVVKTHAAQGGILVNEKRRTKLIGEVNGPEALLHKIQEDDFEFRRVSDETDGYLDTWGLHSISRISLAEGTDDYIYLLFEEKEPAHGSEQLKRSNLLRETLGRVLQFQSDSVSFTQDVLALYFSLLRSQEQQKERHRFHTPRMIAFCSKYADLIGLNKYKKQLLIKTARFHDVGFLNLEDASIGTELNHPLAGREILQSLNIEQEVAEGVATHHEWVNGSGTPAGLRGDAIPWTGKIIGIFEFIIQYIEEYDHSTASASDVKDRLVQELFQRAGKEFDTDFSAAAVQLIEAMSWKDITLTGVE